MEPISDQIIIQPKEAAVEKVVFLQISGQALALTGAWEWGLHSEAVFCTDTMMAFPADFEGTRAIVHPDDLAFVRERLLQNTVFEIENLQFRIITTYNEVKVITGSGISIDRETPLGFSLPSLADTQYELRQALLQTEKSALWDNFRDYTETLSQTGTWHTNTVTNETLYSDNAFRLHGLLPQIINVHPDTFLQFVHEDDRKIVQEAWDSGYSGTAPLHIEYRINRADGKEAFVSLVTHWSYSARGEAIISCFICDETEKKKKDEEVEQLYNTIDFGAQQTKFEEQAIGTGHWQINLLTRKIVYSDNYYRLFGLKPQSIPAGSPVFINYVHPNDREAVEEATANMRKLHQPVDIDFRIVRSDGSIKYIRQRGRTVAFAGSELLIAGYIQDISLQKAQERKLKEGKNALLMRDFVAAQTESLAAAGSWLEDMKSGEIFWSDGMYKLLGHKKEAVRLSEKGLLRSVHPADKEAFLQKLKAAHETEEESSLTVRLLRTGSVIFARAIFRRVRGEEKEYFSATLQDYTKEHELLREAQEKVRISEYVTDNILDRALVTDTNNTILVWNRQCEKLYKIKREAAIGKNFFDLLPQLKNEYDIGLFNTALAGQAIHQTGVKAILRNEYHDLHMEPIRSANGEVLGILHLLRDVTEEIKLTQHLNERISFIEKLLEETVDRIVVLDRNMNYTYWNKKAEAYYRINKEYIIGKNVLEVFPGFSTDPSYKEFRKALDGETVYIDSARTASDEMRPEETYLIPLTDDKGIVTGIMWIVHDLTKDMILKKEQQGAAEILSALNAGCFKLDTAFTVTYINGPALEFFGREREEIEGRLLWEALPSLKGADAGKAFEKAMTEGISVKDEFYLEVPGAPVFLTITPAVDGIVAAFFDMQTEKETGEKLSQSLEQWRALVENSPDAITRWDSNLRMVFSNKALFSVTGKLPEEMLYKTNGQMGYPDAINEPWTDKLRQVFETGKERDHYNSFYSPKGVLHYYSRLVPEYDDKGAVKTVLAIARDITDLRRAGEELAQKNEEMTSFAFIASHDLKEPLRKILTFSSMLQQDHIQLPAKEAGYLGRINHAVKHMQLLIENIITLTQIYHTEDAWSVVDINSVIDTVTAEMEDEIRKAGAVIVKEDLPSISGIPQQLFYLFRNLISNAVKFSRPGEPLIIKITAKETCPEEDGESKRCIKISVADNGIGFEQQYVKKIFRMFQRLHSRDAYPGTGAGLSICRKIMENHKGKITAESIVDKGSVFSCYFPEQEK